MKFVFCLAASLIGLSSADSISAATDARIDASRDNTCTTQQTDCYHDADPTGNWQTASVELKSTDFQATQCCYVYEVIHQNNATTCEDGNPVNPELSHLDMDFVCARPNLRVTGGSVIGPDVTNFDEPTYSTSAADGSTCYYGIKWDQQITKVDGDQSSQYVYDFSVCVAWDGFDVSQCVVATSWMMVKAGPTFDFEELKGTDGVPGCTDPGATPAPVTPAPVTPAPVTPAPVTPAPVTPAPVTPAPVTPAPVVPPPDCVAYGENNLSRDHECICINASQCPDETQYFCKSMSFVTNRLQDPAAPGDLCATGICCCHCPVCSTI